MNEEFASILEDVREAGLLAPGHIAFGGGVARETGTVAAALGPPGPVVLCRGSRPGETAPLIAALQAAGFPVAMTIAISQEPTVAHIDALAAEVRGCAATHIVAMGGGSVIDAAKALSALATNPGSVKDYLEGVGRGFTVEQDPLPLIALPTTAGTGAEMTKNAVIADHGQGFKKSMRDARMIPRAALLDPALTLSVPRAVTAASGMDAITQLIEPCISTKQTPATSALAGRALRGTPPGLIAACDHPGDMSARGTMLLASAISGICLANSGLALAHGVASGLGGLHPVAHGLICGILLPHTLRLNREACEPELAEALRNLLAESSVRPDTIDRGIATLDTLKQQTGVPEDLSFLGLTDDQVHEVAANSMGSSMTGNPVPMTPESTYAFLKPLC